MTAQDWLTQNAQLPYLYLTTVGRTSGTPHRIEIWFAADDDRAFLLSGGGEKSDWVKNLIADQRVRVELGEETRNGIAQIVTADDADDTIARELVARKYASSPQSGAWMQTATPVRITFADE